VTATIVLVAVLTLVALAYVVVPLLVPGQADPLPDERDPVSQDLAEERDALYRAITELDGREDLSEARRGELRTRYEAKAAHVLEALDARRAEIEGQPAAARPRRRRRIPYGVVALLALVGVAAAVLPSMVLPRVGPNANVTTTDAGTARQIQQLQRTADKQPTAKNLMALGDAYWNAQQPDRAIAAYQKVVDTVTPVPPDVYKRLAAVYLQSDLSRAYGYLNKALAAAPNDAETLYAMGEVAFAQGNLGEAKSAFRRYLATPGNSGDSQAKQQIQEIDAVAPLLAKVKQDPSEANLMALAQAYWQHGDEDRAVNVYLQVLTGPNADNVTALSRTGQVLFTSGRSADAVTVLERAAQAAGGRDKLDQESLLMLGNAYFSQQQYQRAIDAWNLYVANAGGPEKAGRVPGLIASAEARLAGGAGASGGQAGRAPANGAQAAGGGPGAGGTAAGTGTGGAGTGSGGTGGAGTGGGGPGSGSAGGAVAGAGTPGGPASAGGGTPSLPSAAAPDGRRLFLADCATCHGAGGQGGAGPALAGNGRAANAANVRDAVRYGRGVMPGFQAQLSDAQIAALVDYVTKVLAAEGR